MKWLKNILQFSNSDRNALIIVQCFLFLVIIGTALIKHFHLKDDFKINSTVVNAITLTVHDEKDNYSIESNIENEITDSVEQIPVNQKLFLLVFEAVEFVPGPNDSIQTRFSHFVTFLPGPKHFIQSSCIKSLGPG